MATGGQTFLSLNNSRRQRGLHPNHHHHHNSHAFHHHNATANPFQNQFLNPLARAYHHLTATLPNATQPHHFHHNNAFHNAKTTDLREDDSLSSVSMLSSEQTKRKVRWILSLGLLLPALAAIIGVVAWAVSAEVVMGVQREAALKNQMPPNITTNVNNQQQDQQTPRQRKGIANGKVTNEKEIAKDAAAQDVAASKANKTKSIINKIINFVFYFSAVLLLAAAFFIFVPWEDWVFDEHEIENYIDMYSEGDGDWVVRQFLATSTQNITEPIFHEVPCHDPSYKMERSFNAAPQTCGLVMTDTLLPEDDIMKLRRMAERITEEVGYQSYSNRESINLKWMNLHKLFKMQKERKNVLKQKEYDLIKKASENAKTLVAEAFGLPREQLGFYLVSQFTRYRQVVPFSEFRHVDKVRSPGLVVTSILWLSTCDLDFGGGRTEFLTGGPEPFTPLMIEPKVGRYAAWTSGHENPHGVMGLNYGDRLALIFAFSVNPNISYKTIDDLRSYAEQAKDIEY